ncbi:hypothetical protein [Microbacterium wangruii]|uniref:hypothetical protein n=1 Tax=Microbacterium wangruii TaxID=3049073 RepID=UPI00256ED879|nr:hypothetical protein [Microbacterium sp. zg-Y1211]MDL5488165.1 hypothetical protein [Microbacterium sp. zg-Y1211]
MKKPAHPRSLRTIERARKPGAFAISRMRTAEVADPTAPDATTTTENKKGTGFTPVPFLFIDRFANSSANGPPVGMTGFEPATP